MGNFTVHVINVKTALCKDSRKPSVYLECVSWSLIVDSCVTTVEYVKIVY